MPVGKGAQFASPLAAQAAEERSASTEAEALLKAAVSRSVGVRGDTQLEASAAMIPCAVAVEGAIPRAEKSQG